MKRSKRKQEIYTVAARLFRSKGYTAASMRDIAEDVGLEPSSLYSHIKSKEEILIDICNECADLFQDGMERVLSQENDPNLQVDALLDLHMNMLIDRPSSVTVFNEEWRHLPEKELEAFLHKRKQYEDNFKKIIARGIEQGIFHPISLTTAINIIISAVKWLHYWNIGKNDTQIESKKLEIKQFIHKGLQAK